MRFLFIFYRFFKEFDFHFSLRFYAIFSCFQFILIWDLSKESVLGSFSTLNRENNLNNQNIAIIIYFLLVESRGQVMWIMLKPHKRCEKGYMAYILLRWESHVTCPADCRLSTFIFNSLLSSSFCFASHFLSLNVIFLYFVIISQFLFFSISFSQLLFISGRLSKFNLPFSCDFFSNFLYFAI